MELPVTTCTPVPSPLAAQAFVPETLGGLKQPVQNPKGDETFLLRRWCPVALATAKHSPPIAQKKYSRADYHP